MALKTLSDLVFRIREVSAARPDLLSARSGRGQLETVSATDFLSNVHSLALAFDALGLVKGDRVAVFSENRPEWPTVDLACQLVGCVTVPLPSADLEDPQVAYILRNSAARLVFYSDAARRDRLLAVQSTLPEDLRMVAFDSDAAHEGAPTLTRLLGEQVERRAAVPIERFRGRVEEDDLASIVYTGGATGDPKGAMLSHRNLVSSVLACAEVFPLGPDDLALSYLPLSHVFQRTFDNLCFYCGARLAYVASEEQVAEEVRHLRPTLLAAEPPVYARAADELRGEINDGSPLRRWAVGVGERWAAERDDGFVGPILALQRRLAEGIAWRALREIMGGRLRLALCVGAALDAHVDELFEAIDLPIYPAYSLTEAASLVAANAPGRHRPETLGQALPGVELRRDDAGEILVRGPGVIGGYWQDAEATRRALDDEGWLRTGDLGEVDRDGYLVLEGRKHRGRRRGAD